MAKVYIVLRGGLANVYKYLQGGRGGSKSPKSCLRRKWMPPYLNPSRLLLYKIFYLFEFFFTNFYFLQRVQMSFLIDLRDRQPRKEFSP